MITVLCFGNEFLKEDSLAKELADEITIEGVKFIKCNSPDEILDKDLDKVVILDVVKDLDKVILFDDIDKIKERKLYSMHDFDLGFFLKLMKKTKQITTIKIIGIPQNGEKDSIKKEIIKSLNNLK